MVGQINITYTTRYWKDILQEKKKKRKEEKIPPPKKKKKVDLLQTEHLMQWKNDRGEKQQRD